MKTRRTRVAHVLTRNSRITWPQRFLLIAVGMLFGLAWEISDNTPALSFWSILALALTFLAYAGIIVFHELNRPLPFIIAGVHIDTVDGEALVTNTSSAAGGWHTIRAISCDRSKKPAPSHLTETRIVD